jgi:type IV pilus assembly protein PilE
MAFKKSRQHGMTLLELMIVVAIVGILATIAIPSFNDQVLKSRRAEARNALFDAQLKQAEYFANNFTYGWRAEIGADEFTTNNYYRISVRKPDGEDFTTGFEMRATPVSGEGQENDTLCTGSGSPLYFCVDETGVITDGWLRSTVLLVRISDGCTFLTEFDCGLDRFSHWGGACLLLR